MSAEPFITEHLDLWTEAVTTKSTGGRGSSGKIELTGIKKLRELILELALRGKLVPQDRSEEHAVDLLEEISSESVSLAWKGDITKLRKIQKLANEEIPFNVPEGWIWVRLSQICYLENGDRSKNYPNKSVLVQSGVPFVNAGHLENYAVASDGLTYITEERFDLLRSGKFRRDDILFCLRGSLGKCALVCDIERGAIASSLIITRPLLTGLSTYLMLFLQAPLAELFIRRFDNGTAQPNLSGADFAKFPLPLPGKKEQHRIVQKVDELMTLCDRLEQQTHDQHAAHETLVDALLDTLTQSKDADELADNWARLAAHFDTLFTTEHSIDRLKLTIVELAVMGRLLPQDPNDEPAFVLLERIKETRIQHAKASKRKKTATLPTISADEKPFELPIGWQLSRLEDLTDIQSGIAKGKKIVNKETIMLPYLRVANVQRSALNLSEVKEIEVSAEDSDRYLVLRRDLLITEGGDWDKVGRTAIWDGSVTPMAHQNHVFRARLVLAEQNERWLEKYLNSGFARQYFADSSKQTTNLASINKTQLRSCTIPVPPLAEQHRIVQKVDGLMAVCDQFKTRLTQASETRRQMADAVVEQAIH